MGYLLIILGTVYIVFRILATTRTKDVPVVFAGSPKEGAVIRKLAIPRNNPIFREGDRRVDVSDFNIYTVEGNSLEPLGIQNGSLLYVDEKENEKKADDLIGHFIILKIDNERTRKEHPEKTLSIDGYKARKVIAVFKIELTEDQVKEELQKLVDRNPQLNAKLQDAEFKERIVKKYLFASSYYKNEKELLVSITYKEGTELDYSFHSSSFLKGIVRYKSNGGV